MPATEFRAGAVARGFAWIVTSPARYLIILGWLAAVVAAVRYLPSAAGVDTGGGGSIGAVAPNNATALRAEERSYSQFAFPVLSRIAIVQRDPHGLALDAQERVVDRAAMIDEHPGHDVSGIMAALPVINTAKLFPSSREDSTTAIAYLFFPPWRGLFTQTRLAKTYARTAITHPDDKLVGVTGIIPARVAEGNIIAAALPWIEVGTILLIIIIVGFTFRSIGAPLVTLAASGIAYSIALRLVGLVAKHAGLAIPIELEPLLVVLILAVCTDYAVFFFSGAMRRLQVGDLRVVATRAATSEFVPIIVTAGLTIVGCTACLALADLDFLRALGPALAIGVAMSLLVAITFVPACLAAAGRVLFWPSMKIGEAPGLVEGRMVRWRFTLARRLSTKKPAALVMAMVCIALLGAAASGLGRMGLGLPLLSDLPSTTQEARALHAATLGFAPGIADPSMLIVEGAGLTAQRAALVRLEGMLARQPGVAGVIGPREQPPRQPYNVVYSRDGRAARYVLILNADPLGAQAIDWLRGLQGRMPALLRQAGLPAVRASVAGDTALAGETIDRTVHAMIPISGAIALVVLVALAFLLRSLVAPFYLLFASILATAAPLGLLAYLFQSRLGFAYVGYYAPLGAGVLLIALGSDYNLFVVGRVWEEAQSRPLCEAITVAVPRATGAISTAALTLAASFALLAIVPLVSFREFAFAMVAGVLIDAFVVRSYLVLALMALFGRLSLWPRTVPVPPAEPASAGARLEPLRAPPRL